ncbi:unnamed protein product [Calypogeia fissa]
MATTIPEEWTRQQEAGKPVVTSSVKLNTNSGGDLDNAFTYIQNACNGGDIDTSTVDLAKLRRKIDWHIVPFMFLCYTVQFLDKVNLNYAAVMGLNKDLHLEGNDFSNASTAFFIAFLIAELPNGYILQKLPAGKWLGCNVIAWGIATACVAATTNYNTLLITRIFIGIFEAAVAPCLMLIGSQYYTRSEQAPRFSLWYCGVGVAQIVGGLVSYGFQHVSPKASPNGWRLMFIVLGAVTVPIGALAGWILPNTPMSAKWMTEAEKVTLLNHVSENRTGIENPRFKAKQVLELLLDVQIWLLTIITVLMSISSGVITSYSSTLIRNFGYTPEIAALLNMPSGIVSILSALIVGFGVQFINKGHRWIWLVACCLCGILGGGLMSFAPSSNQAALLAGIYLVNAITATLIILYQWTMANVAGRTKRAVASALIAGSFSVGNIIGPQTFRAKDAPQYRPAKIIVLATQAGGAVVTVVLFAYYVWANRRKERRQRKLGIEGVQIDALEDTWGNLTDNENVEFRYVY